MEDSRNTLNDPGATIAAAIIHTLLREHRRYLDSLPYRLLLRIERRDMPIVGVRGSEPDRGQVIAYQIEKREGFLKSLPLNALQDTLATFRSLTHASAPISPQADGLDYFP